MKALTSAPSVGLKNIPAPRLDSKVQIVTELTGLLMVSSFLPPQLLFNWAKMMYGDEKNDKREETEQ